MSEQSAATVARQAALLEADLADQQPMGDLMDTGVIARRTAPRSRVAEVNEALTEARINLAMMRLHRRCTSRPMGRAFVEHLNHWHREDAEAVVDALFPEGLL